MIKCPARGERRRPAPKWSTERLWSRLPRPPVAFRSCRVRSAASSLRPRLDFGQGPPRSRLAAIADAPAGLDAAVDADEGADCFGAVPPADPRPGDDPGVLVEPVTQVGGRGAAA